MRKEMIEKYGNNMVAYDATETFKPLVLCYWDEEYVLTYDIHRDKHNYVRMTKQIKEDGDYTFTVNGIRYHMANFVRVGSPWDGLGIKSIEEWKEQCN